MKVKRYIYIIFVLLLASELLAQKKPRNIILLIGDGMGIAQLYAAQITNGNSLNMISFPYTGLMTTNAANNFITDSGAAGTALATGQKTNNGMIGMNADSVAIPSITNIMKSLGKATGIVTTCNLTHATPASFMAHQINRNMYDEIAIDIVNSDVDIMIGGGRKNFENRSDKRGLSSELNSKGYTLVYSLENLLQQKSTKIVGLLFEDHPPAMPERGNLLPISTKFAIERLNENKNGFFIMIEGSQIDWAGHGKNEKSIILETIDFDKAVGVALEFAKKDKNTLVIVTADHETGGLSLLDGNIESQSVVLNFSKGNHTALPVPVFAYGPGSEIFTGYYDNTDILKKILKTLSVSKR